MLSRHFAHPLQCHCESLTITFGGKAPLYHQSLERFYSLEHGRAHLPLTEEWVNKVMRRLTPLLPDRPLRVLEIGSGQGRGLIALDAARPPCRWSGPLDACGADILSAGPS